MPVKKTTKKLETPQDAGTTPLETKTKSARRAAAPKTAAATHKSAATRAPRAAKEISKPAFDPSLHHEEIAREAYYLWEARGYSHGADHQDWLSAVEIVRARYI